MNCERAISTGAVLYRRAKGIAGDRGISEQTVASAFCDAADVC